MMTAPAAGRMPHVRAFVEGARQVAEMNDWLRPGGGLLTDVTL
jgi:hypothetical protein